MPALATSPLRSLRKPQLQAKLRLIDPTAPISGNIDQLIERIELVQEMSNGRQALITNPVTDDDQLVIDKTLEKSQSLTSVKNRAQLKQADNLVPSLEELVALISSRYSKLIARHDAARRNAIAGKAELVALLKQDIEPIENELWRITKLIGSFQRRQQKRELDVRKRISERARKLDEEYVEEQTQSGDSNYYESLDDRINAAYEAGEYKLADELEEQLTGVSVCESPMTVVRESGVKVIEENFLDRLPEPQPVDLPHTNTIFTYDWKLHTHGLSNAELISRFKPEYLTVKIHKGKINAAVRKHGVDAVRVVCTKGYDAIEVFETEKVK